MLLTTSPNPFARCSYDVSATENDPIVAFQCLPVGGGGGGGSNFCSLGEESKRGQQIVCVSSDR